ncbi:ABC transporter ATP-binding protein [Echinicola salinicaeni]|uniref:ABC transporter ATP-binding protein n=1 Tax=Echinicola salinicaeni TaxID=2762757 RepID=UPI001645E6C1|nr:ABC transporter ATP-binding protein [Echinicola salinicaeni]
MSKTVIKVENLSKRYRIGLKEKKADTLAQQLVNTIKYPFQNFQRIKNLGRFQEDQEEGVHWALKDVSFEVKEGEVLGIIGKNGAGKSTLLKILSKITEPTSGRIEINGRIAALLEVGTGFHPELSGRENIYMNGTILGMTKREIDRKLDEIIDFSGVEKYIDTPVKFYSSGMRVRLGFSVAAHLEPEILVIDEVLAVGDHEFQKKCLGKMEDVSKNEGRTVLFVSHNMGAVQNLCDKILIIKNGFSERIIDTNYGILNYLENNFQVADFSRSSYIEKVELLDSNQLPSNLVKSKGLVYLNIYTKIKVDLSNYDIGFFIKDKFGNKISAASTSFKKPIVGNILKSEDNLIQFILKDIKLIDDIYKVDISIVKKEGGRIEFFENILSFQVESNDFYNSGTVLNNHYGKLYLDYDYYI